TRPGADLVPVAEEIRRVVPVVERLAAELAVPISIDTYKPETAKEALAAGATILNDVTGLREPAMVRIAAASQCAVVCMHMRGTPQTMQQLTEYVDPTRELTDYFADRLNQLAAGGVAPERVLLDPGIGFAKRRPHNLDLLRRLHEFHALGRPVLLGASRKRILGELIGRDPQATRLFGTISTTVLGYLRGVHVFRVHDAAAVRDALNVAVGIEEGIEP
ncbi:MAG: dihydropteroate synthase, partial [Planctomycetia bacterium]